MDRDHSSHKWRYSDSSYYDFVCTECGCAEFTEKAVRPCEAASYCADRYKDAIQHINAKEDMVA